MNAINFIKERGVDKAMEAVEGAPEWALYFDGYLYSEKWFHGNSILISDLKRLVKSVDLVNSYGGLKDAIDFISGYTEEQLAKPVYSPMLRLKQAIADYEQIFGGEHV
ncbi:hypothetical protein [Acinetobacter modestus]|uniref:hypothetical protein n=1 Tax=Acinetobacter modestus TaxID=1776740 RepID=UPI003017A8E5